MKMLDHIKAEWALAHDQYDDALSVALRLPGRWHWLITNALIIAGAAIEDLPGPLNMDWWALPGILLIALFITPVSIVILMPLFPLPYAWLAQTVGYGVDTTDT